MAFSGSDGVLVWQKVSKALLGANPQAQAAFRDLKNYMVTQGGNPQLQFATYTTTQATTNNGTDLIGGACTLYGWYGKAARSSGTTASFMALHDAADNSATTTTVVTRKINLTGQQFAYTDAFGHACATGLTVSAATAVGGSTESSAADACNGFVIVGA